MIQSTIQSFYIVLEKKNYSGVKFFFNGGLFDPTAPSSSSSLSTSKRTFCVCVSPQRTLVPPTPGHRCMLPHGKLSKPPLSPYHQADVKRFKPRVFAARLQGLLKRANSKQTGGRCQNKGLWYERLLMCVGLGVEVCRSPAPCQLILADSLLCLQRLRLRLPR